MTEGPGQASCGSEGALEDDEGMGAGGVPWDAGDRRRGRGPGEKLALVGVFFCFRKLSVYHGPLKRAD